MPAAGDVLGRYHLESLIGEGGMGRVFRAFDDVLKRRVALKLLLDGSNLDESEAKARLLREARAAAALDHPNAVRVYDVGEHEGIAFIAMELVEGRPLREVLTTKPSIDDVLRWLGDVAAALAAAHDLGLVHRDVKPENVVIDKGNRARVLDFGIARASGGAVTRESLRVHLAALTMNGTRIGTPSYMPPEQLAGESVDGRADQFAWGVMAYEALTGRLPWDPQLHPVARANAIANVAPRPISSLVDVPAEIAVTIHRTLAADRTARFASMHHVLAVLDLDQPRAPRGRVPTGPATAFAPTVAQPTEPLPCRPGASPFQINGVPYRGFVQLVTKLVPGGFEAFVDAIDDLALRAFLRQPFLAGARYDALPFVPLYQTLARLLDSPFEQLVRETSAAQARYDARKSYQSVLVGSPSEFAKRGALLGARYFDFGTLTHESPGPGVMVVHLVGLPEYLVRWYLPMHTAYTEGVMRGRGVRDVKTVSSEASRDGVRGPFPLVRIRSEFQWKE